MSALNFHVSFIIVKIEICKIYISHPVPMRIIYDVLSLLSVYDSKYINQ